MKLFLSNAAIALILGGFTIATLAAESSEPSDSSKVAFVQAAKLMETGRYKEAIPLLQQVAKELPENENVLWNLGIANAETGNHREALAVWKRYHEAAPEDWRAIAKLIQAYQALEDTVLRDKERERLYEMREKSTEPSLKTLDKFCREQCMIAGKKVFAFEYFEATGNRKVFYRFSVVDGEGKESFYVSLGSYDSTTDIARELGQAPPDQRVYHLDRYEKGNHKTYAFYKEKPSYDSIRVTVVKVLEGKQQPISGSSNQKR